MAELEQRAKPPEPFKPTPYQRYDPTANMSMPASTLREMANAVPENVMRDIALRDSRAPTGRPGMIPQAQPTGGGGPANVPGSGTGWAREIPAGPSMHQRYVDQQLDAQDQRDRAALMQQHAQLKLAEQTETVRQQIEALAKRMGQKT